MFSGAMFFAPAFTDLPVSVKLRSYVWPSISKLAPSRRVDPNAVKIAALVFCSPGTLPVKTKFIASAIEVFPLPFAPMHKLTPGSNL
jgi:hypothetical protein